MSDNPRDTKFAGFAELLFRDLSRLGLVALVDVRNFPDNPDRAMELQDEMNQLTKQIFARRAYDLADHLIKHIHGSDLYEMQTEGLTHFLEVSYPGYTRLPDLTQWPDLPDSE